MNPLENEIREVLKRQEPPKGFAERVISEAGRMAPPRLIPRSTISRLTVPAFVIVIAAALVGITGVLMTRCASACSIGGLGDSAVNSSSNAVTAGGGHSRGPEKAEVVLEEFGDYECPSCEAYYPVVEEIIHRFPDQVRFEYHHFPLTGIHKNAMGAALAAEAAGDQNHFWEMHALLYQHRKEWAKVSNADEQFTAFAVQIGLDLNRFKESLESPKTKQRVMDDKMRGEEAKIGGTPTFFLNGKVIPLPATVHDFAALIESRLNDK